MSVIRYTLFTAGLFAAMACFCATASGQMPVGTLPKIAPAGSAPNDVPANKTGGKIQLDVEVTTQKGKPAAPITQQDLTLFDNKSQRTLTSFAAVNGADTPVEVIIVVDSVNTPYIYLAYQRDQIAKYLRGGDGMLPYPTTFAVLTDLNFNVYGKMSKNGTALAQALDNTDIGLREINRDQGFYGANDRLTISVNALSELLKMESKKPGRKLILWVSPGWPLLSGPEVELDGKQEQGVYQSVIAANDEMRNGDITLYHVNSWGAAENVGREFYYESFLDGLKKPSDAVLGNLALQVIATQSGGLVLNSSDVIGMIKQCVADADHYYRITFDSPPDEKSNQYNDLKIKLGVGGLVARTRTGFYAQP